MAQGKHNFLNVTKCTADERAHMENLAGKALPAKLYSNNSGEWYALKVAGETSYTVVTFSELAYGQQGPRSTARTLAGVRKAVEALHNARTDAKASGWSW